MNFEEKNKDEIKIHGEKEIKKGLKLLGSAKIHPNHKVFEFNIETSELKQASKIDNNVISWSEANKQSKPKTKILVKEKCIYFHALNMKSAKKKLFKEYKIQS